ncbi:MAG: hypothetical protein Q8O68_00805 [Candidatus Daviesbacteria bacterium]|nr:hypothetical protein [Candidatus Daviesbacteria bacterium]
MNPPTNQDILPNHFVFINAYNQFFKIGEVEPFQFDTGQESTAIFSSVAVGGSSGFKSISEMEPDQTPVRHLFQALIGVKYDFKYYVKLPSGTNRFGSDVTKSIGFIDSELSPLHHPNKNFQMWFVNNFFPAVEAQNQSAEPLTPLLRFVGFKYELKPVDENTLQRLQSGSLPFKHVTVGGLS